VRLPVIMAAMRQSVQNLKRLRSLMKDKTFVSEAIQAYIIPSGDAHQVNLSYTILNTLA